MCECLSCILGCFLQFCRDVLYDHLIQFSLSQKNEIKLYIEISLTLHSNLMVSKLNDARIDGVSTWSELTLNTN